MTDSKLAKICGFYDIGRFLLAEPIVKPGLLHKVLRLQTTKGFYFLKQYSIAEKNQLILMMETIKTFSNYDVLLSQPIINSANCFFEDGDYLMLVFPWIDGKRLELEDITSAHIQIIAKILGKIHSLSIVIPQALPIISPIIDDEIFSHHKLAGSFEVHQCYTKFLAARDLLQKNQIISHGDLLSANVLWKSNHHPVLIDWDHCGWINKDIDLFNTAINWAGIEKGRVDMGKYWVFMDMYRHYSARPIQISTKLIHASLGSWLNWLAFVVKKMPKERVKQQLEVTLKALKYLNENDTQLSIALT